MYDSQCFFVANPIDRYSITPRQELKTHPDGSSTCPAIARQGPGIELARRAARRFHPHDAPVPA
jgi:hypothetical protein